MKEIVDLFYTILFIPIPMPISFGQVMYYNLFGIIVVFLLIFICSLVISRLMGGSNND